MASIRYIVNDIDGSVEFYRDKLEFIVDMHNPGKFAALIRHDLTLYLSAPGAGSGGTAGGTPKPGDGTVSWSLRRKLTFSSVD